MGIFNGIYPKEEFGDAVKSIAINKNRFNEYVSGVELLKKVAGILEEIAEIDKESSLEGRRMSIILRPR